MMIMSLFGLNMHGLGECCKAIMLARRKYTGMRRERRISDSPLHRWLDHRFITRVLRSLFSIFIVGAVAACGGVKNGYDSNPTADQANVIRIGTTDKVINVDPAGSYDTGSFQLQMQVFPFLYFPDYTDVRGGTELRRYLASDDGSWNGAGTTFTVHLKSGLRWANGHILDSKDVKYSYDRIKKIADPRGPASLLVNISGIDAPNPTTVIFHSKIQHDVTLKKIIGGSPASPIVDDQAFPDDRILPSDKIIAADAFAGPYRLTEYSANQSVKYQRNAHFQGFSPARNEAVEVRYYAAENSLQLALRNREIDLAYRTLSPTVVEALSKERDLKVIKGPGGEERHLAFNFRLQPFGEGQPDRDPVKARAVRQAVADLIDRRALATDVFKDTEQPLYSFMPTSVDGSVDTLKGAYGDGKGGPDESRARQRLRDAGITTPVKLKIQYNTDHYGSTSTDAYAALGSQLKVGGLFTVSLQQTSWSEYADQRRVTDSSDGSYPLFQIGWGPDFVDPDNYLSPFYRSDISWVSNGYRNPRIDKLLKRQLSEQDQGKRIALIHEIQHIETQDLSTIPLVQKSQIVVARNTISHVVLNASTLFSFAPIVKKG